MNRSNFELRKVESLTHHVDANDAVESTFILAFSSQPQAVETFLNKSCRVVTRDLLQAKFRFPRICGLEFSCSLFAVRPDHENMLESRGSVLTQRFLCCFCYHLIVGLRPISTNG